MLGESQQDTHDHGTTAKVSQDLSASQFFGTSLPAKTLALTFDDGPGTRTAELSMYLKAQGIRAAFFMNGARFHAPAAPLVNPNSIPVTPNGPAILAQVLADGHLVANHTTTHRNLTSEVPDAQRVQELSDTDADIAAYVSPQNHLLFRAPFGAYNGAVWNTLGASPMNKYVGPIYWEAGGFSNQYPTAAADWACWQGELYTGGTRVNLIAGSPGYATTAQCGDAYLTEINSFGKGIVLMHDPYSWAQGSTVDMVKYLVPKLVAAGYSFVRVDNVPTIAAVLPPAPCNPTCATCSGPAANQCTACLGGQYRSGGQCLLCTTCGADQYRVSACTTTADTTCAACSACGAGTYPSAACTTTANATCTACPAGSFTNVAGAAACTSCGSCDDGDACTEDRCDPAKGCVHDAIASCKNDSGAPGGLGDDVDAGAPGGLGDRREGDGGCSVPGASGRTGSGHDEHGLYVLSALGLSLLVRRRSREATQARVG